MDQFGYRATVAYEGTGYRGWQRQPGVATVAGALQIALERAVGEAPRIRAAGRTDAGAHARGQVVAFGLRREWAADALAGAVNRALPDDVRMLSAARAPLDFNPRRDAWRRTYRYLVSLHQGLPAARPYAWRVRHPLELDLVRAASRQLGGRHDFAAFGSSPEPGGNTQRGLDRVEVSAGGNLMVFEFRGDAFLRGMVRSLTGALVAVGMGRLAPEGFHRLLAEARPGAGRRWAAPAHGLYLWGVEYRNLQGAW